MALIATVPPRSRARSAATTTSPTGANVTAASSGSGGFSSYPPAQIAPMPRARSRSRCDRRVRAEVLAAGPAEAARAVDGRQPPDSGALADLPVTDVASDRLDDPDRLVAQHCVGTVRRHVPGRELEICATDRAGRRPQQEPARTGNRIRDLPELQRFRVRGSGPLEDERLHRPSLAPGAAACLLKGCG